MLTANHKADVIFLGERSDIPDILAASDVFVLSSTREGLPMTILEAMAAEVPIVTTPAGGIPDVIKDGLTGLVVDFGDDHGLAAAFNTIRENPSAAREMAARAFDLVQSEYSSRAMTKKYLAIE
ncbi:MAG: glycosyltransferase [Candidatus Omnitrophota bacterium]